MATTTQQLIRWKQERRRIVVLTAYDYITAQILDKAGIDIILVGDSLGMVALGYENTLPVTLDEMLHHAKAVRRGVKNALVVVDLPFLSYQESPQQALRNAGRILKETGAQAVKLEGGHPSMAETISMLTNVGIPVMGHVGLTPQSVHQLGGYRQQGNTPETGDRILSEAISIEQSGAFAIVLEHIPSSLAVRITETLSIPTIGIGAGPDCDGQVLVIADVLGLSEKLPPFAKSYLNLRNSMEFAISEFSKDVKEGNFP